MERHHKMRDTKQKLCKKFWHILDVLLMEQENAPIAMKSFEIALIINVVSQERGCDESNVLLCFVKASNSHVIGYLEHCQLS